MIPMVITYSADFADDTTALLRHLAEAHGVLDVDPADAMNRHDHEHQVVEPQYVTARWIAQHGHSCRPVVLS